VSLPTGGPGSADEFNFTNLLAGVEFPEMAVVRLNLPVTEPVDLTRRVPDAVRSLVDASGLPAGTTVAVAAGSRGISNISIILRLVVKTLQEAGLQPYVVAAMGSHGGGTVAGQEEILAVLGITEESIGAPVRVTADAVLLGHTASGLPVYCDAEAAAAGAVLVVNRIKPHTSFQGEIGSGLCKMLAVGLGKKEGAAVVHGRGPAGMEEAITSIARFMLDRLPVMGGLAILEDGYDRTARVTALPPGDWPEQERSLYSEAVSYLPRLPFADVDLLIVDEMGKNISGTGMDTNVLGRWRTGGPEPPGLRAGRVVVLRLHPASHGNANGVGLADVTTRALAEAVDFPATYLNALTSTFVERVKLPMVMPTEKLAIAAALKTLGTGLIRAVRIKNTRELEHIAVSPPLLAELAESHEQVTPVAPMQFSDDGRLLDPTDGW